MLLNRMVFAGDAVITEDPSVVPAEKYSRPVWCGVLESRGAFTTDGLREMVKLDNDLNVAGKRGVDGEWYLHSFIRDLGVRTIIERGPYAIRFEFPEDTKFMSFLTEEARDHAYLLIAHMLGSVSGPLGCGFTHVLDPTSIGLPNEEETDDDES